MAEGVQITDFQSLEEQNMIRFKVHRFNVSQGNAIRRILISEVPTLAVELVEIYENESPLHDEFISHRIGLLPIDSNDVDNFNFCSECDSEYLCEKCSVSFACEVKNDTENNITVSSADFVSDNPKYQMLFNKKDGPTIPITKLAPGQSIKLTAIAMKGIGQEHQKWSPVTVCKCMYFVNDEDDLVTQFKQYEEPTDFTFELETVDSIKPKKALLLASDILIDKLLKFDRTIDSIKI